MSILSGAKGSLYLLFFGGVFLLSGLIINAVQLVLFLTIHPFNPSLRRRLNAKVVVLHWVQLVSLAQWWSGVKVRFFDTDNALDTMGSTKALCICNHHSDVDWLIGYCIAETFECLGGAKSMMKEMAKYVPIIGWAWWFSDYPFLKRKWEVDQARLDQAFATLTGYDFPYWITIFAEGTRFTETKHAESLAYARDHPEKNLPVLNHLLLPKPKGFCYTYHGLKKSLDIIYDVTFAFPEGKEPNLTSIYSGTPGDEVHILLRRIDPLSLPQDEAGLSKFLRDLWAEKDALLDQHQKDQIFKNAREVKRPRPVRPVVVHILWSLLFVIANIYFAYWAIVNQHFLLLGSLVGMAALLLIFLTILINITVSDASKRGLGAALVSKKKKSE